MFLDLQDGDAVLLLTWNMAHAGPAHQRGTGTAQWTLVAEQRAAVIFAQEAKSPSLHLLPDYDVAFAPRPGKKHGLAIAVRQDVGRLEGTHVSTDVNDLAVWAEISGRRCLLVSTHVHHERNAKKALDRALLIAAGLPLLIGGDFNAGPSIAKDKPGPQAAVVGMKDLTFADPELNTLRRPGQTRDLQIDHIFSRGFNAAGSPYTLPVAEPGGPGLSDHNALLVEVA